MSDDGAESRSSEEEFIPFSKRVEFSDVVPVPQDDGPVPVCPINYEPEFADTMSYFRALLLKDERSPRALEVTTSVIEVSAANYTAWHYRRAILDSLHPPQQPDVAATPNRPSNDAWLSERHFVTEVAREHPKNYQVWFHRRCVVERLRAQSAAQGAAEALLGDELDVTAEVLRVDGKNYHAWAHRQWALNTFGSWSRELAFVDTELNKDVRNNSAWNERWIALSHLHGPVSSWSIDLRREELHYSQAAIARAPNNESAWNYVRGLFGEPGAHLRCPDLEQWCLAQRSSWPTCASLLATLVDVGEEALSLARDEVVTKARLQSALEACQALADGVDDIHAKFWRRRKHRLLAQRDGFR
jgi:protein farnesyltransferase/geranylgeranyltransferase type-1 subunit alpha